MKYQLFPNLTADEMEALTADIKARGVMVPVEVDENDDILDGHHRAVIADSLGVEYPKIVREGWSEEQKLTHVVALNAHRRQLTSEQRAEVVGQLRKARMSTRSIAKAVGVSKDTVRRDLIGADAPMPATVQTTDGRSYPAFRPRLADDIPYTPKPEPTDYIDRMPPALQEEERDFRKRGRWSTQIHAATSALLSVEAHEYAELLDADDREDTERSIDLIESWIERTRKALGKTGLRVVGGKR